MDDSALTALVSSRICHDLISPIGAISNGVELMTELNGGGTAELDLISDSATSAAVKLRYFRIAFGNAATDALVSAEELRLAVSSMFGERHKVTLDLDAANVGRVQAKALLLCLLCSEKSLPLGGTVAARVRDGHVAVSAVAPRTRALPDRWEALGSGQPPEDLAPADVQFLILGRLIHAFGLTLRQEVTETGLDVELSNF